MTPHIPSFDGARVVVIGDVMLDRYWHGDTSRISPEAPVPVVHVRDTLDRRPGGAANVAVNIATLGGSPVLLGVVGEDAAADELESLLGAAGVEFVLPRAPGARTVTKMRVLSRHQQLIRLDLEEGVPPVGREYLEARWDEYLASAPVVVLSDYGKGTLTDPGAVIGRARDAGSLVLVDPKGRDYSRYRGASLITPNLAEFEEVVGPCATRQEIEARGQSLRRELDIDGLLVTRGDRGMVLLSAAGTLAVEAWTREVYDVTGAGDTVIAALAAAMAAGLGMEAATRLANLAASVVVGKLGTASVTRRELEQAQRAVADAGPGIREPDRVVELVEIARGRGETIVMTNGCFDILHAGHVSLLRRARALGDRLLVAVNDDDSVRRLKGEGRPLNPVGRRMEVLAALACVDWVVPFPEDTPERLICALKPHLLVKGGDYRPDAVAGGDCVREAGGRVEILDLEPGISTSAIIESLLDTRRQRRI